VALSSNLSSASLEAKYKAYRSKKWNEIHHYLDIISASHLAFHLLGPDYNQQDQQTISQQVKQGKNGEFEPVQIIDRRKRINDGQGEIFGKEDDQSRSEEAINLRHEAHYHRVISLPVSDPVGDGLEGEDVILDVFRDGFNAHRCQQYQSGEQSNQNGFV